MSNDPITDLVTLLSNLPGVGERTARRYAHALLGQAPDRAQELGRALSELHTRVTRCRTCQAYAFDTELCRICSDYKRDQHVLCVVARVPDLEAIERGGFRGRYHVLHALLAPLDGWGPDKLNANMLSTRVLHENIQEVILALPHTVDGGATSEYLAAHLRDHSVVQVTRIASGMAYGHELEYADPMTIEKAMQGRR